MININLIRENPDKIKKAIKLKNYDTTLVDQVLVTYKKFLELQTKLEDLNNKKNRFAKEKNITEGKITKQEIRALEPDVLKSEEEYKTLLNQIPNLPLDGVPEGKGEKDNIEIKKWGKIPSFGWEPKDHLALGKNLDLIDFEAGAKVAGSQFYFLKGDAVLLEQALINFGLEILSQKGYKLISTPDLAKSRFYLGTGYLPKGKEAQIYEITGEDLGLIATAEVTMAGYHADEVLKKADLPIKYAALSHSFRQEAGAYGKYSKGLYRVHQFTKLEMFIYTTPSGSEKMHQEILAVEEEIYQKLEIPYRVLEMVTGDLGAIAAKKFDIEAWMPGRGEYGEVTSTSNTTDYQARNLNIKYREGDHNEFVHMLNGTAIAVSRTLIAIIENYQQKDGSIAIPKVLQKWMGKEKITK